MTSLNAHPDAFGLAVAYKHAEKSYSEGGVPIGAALVRTADGGAPVVLGQGHNARVQRSSAILHGETAALEDAGRLAAEVYRKCTMVSCGCTCRLGIELRIAFASSG